MSGRIRGAAIALGLIIVIPGALAQERIQPTLESQPGPGRQRQEAAEAGQHDAAPEQESAPDLLPAIQGIEAALRDLIPNENNAARQRQEDRENADLKAQQKMARWTILIGIAAFLSVVLTAVGVLLIWWTLKHTATAAIAAKEAVEEAKKTTVIAEQTASEARTANGINRQFFISEQRAWIRISDPKAIEEFRWESPQKAVFKIGYHFTNIGKSPAFNVRVHSVEAVGSRGRSGVLDMVRRFSKNPQPLETNLLFPTERMNVEARVTVSLPQCGERWPTPGDPERWEYEYVCSFFIISAIEYYLAPGEQQRHTAFTYHLTKERWSGPINIPIGCDPIPVNEMKFRAALFHGRIAT